MNSFGGTSEIVEAKDELNPVCSYNGCHQFGFKLKTVQRDGKAHVYPVEDDLNRIIEAIDLKTTKKVLAPSRHIGVDLIHEGGIKKAVKLGLSQASGRGNSEAVTLKQALRRLCIAQASEMAAMKRLSQPIGLSGVSEAGTIKRLYASVMVEANESGLPPNDREGTSVEVSLFPEKIVINSVDKASEICRVADTKSSCKKELSSSETAVAKASTAERTRIQGTIVSLSKRIVNNSRGEVKTESRRKRVTRCSQSSSHNCAESSKPSVNSRLKRPAFRKTIGAQKKEQREQSFTLGSSSRCDEINKAHTNLSCQMECALASSGVVKSSGPTITKKKGGDAVRPDFISKLSKCGEPTKSTINGSSRSREKGECSQSSKSSMGDYSSSTSISDESNQSVSRSFSCRPHMSKDVRWMAIHNIIRQHGSLGLKNFKLRKRLGCGDIGTVYLAELIGSQCLFALKVMDNEFLMSRKKMLRAQTEREILHMLDHPFLPTLYANFTSDSLSCLVMEYCPGGDLHILRQKQAGGSFSEVAARFYVAEVLLAIEYLHMLGVVYRDLKPENILIREDGHIMLSDFDLSLRCTVNPMLLSSSINEKAQEAPEKGKPSGPCPESGCISPLCLQPSWVQVSCFTPCAASLIKPKMHKPKSDQQPLQGDLLPQLVVEPTDARSNSFVGTYEYLAPEIIRGDGHGNAVDWWTLGIFLYELLFGRTPFKGSGNEDTLSNVVSQSLVFPESPAASASAKDLITGLLMKEPDKRLGSTKGAAEIKQHPFFEGLNWALIRSGLPPETPKCIDVGTPATVPEKKDGKCRDFGTKREVVEFEIF